MLALELLDSSKEAAQIFLTRAAGAVGSGASHAAVEAERLNGLRGTAERQAPKSSMSWSKLIHSHEQLRGIEAKKRLLSAEGGMLSTQEVASVLDISPQAVHKRRRAGKLIGIVQDSVLLPSLAVRGQPHSCWPHFDVLGDHDPLMQVVFMLNPNDRLDGQRPLDLHAGRL